MFKKSLDGREIFSENEDFEFWERLMADYLLPYTIDLQSPYKQIRPYRVRHKQQMNMYGKIELLSYCLMPTYIYMVIREREKGALTSFVRKISTYYSMVYNKKRGRSGYVFEGSYKKLVIGTQADLQNFINLVHLLPASGRIIKKFGVVQTSSGVVAKDYLYSSMRDYLLLEPRKWVSLANIEPMGRVVGRLPW